MIKRKHSAAPAKEQLFAYLHLLVIKLNLVFFMSCNNYIKRSHHNKRHKETPDSIDQESAKAKRHQGTNLGAEQAGYRET